MGKSMVSCKSTNPWTKSLENIFRVPTSTAMVWSPATVDMSQVGGEPWKMLDEEKIMIGLIGMWYVCVICLCICNFSFKNYSLTCSMAWLQGNNGSSILSGGCLAIGHPSPSPAAEANSSSACRIKWTAGVGPGIWRKNQILIPSGKLT